MGTKLILPQRNNDIILSKTALTKLVNLSENQFLLASIVLPLHTCFLTTELDGHIVKSSVIRQKGESQNGCFKKTKYAYFSERQHFLTPDQHTG